MDSTPEIDEEALMAEVGGYDVADVEALVKSLYEPHPVNTLDEIQAKLIVLQRSNHGWELADRLLNSSDPAVQFHAANTFTVKLNTDSASLNEAQSNELLAKIFQHLLTLTLANTKSDTMVTRKLCSTLAIYFCKPICSPSWFECLRSLHCSFLAKALMLEDSFDQFSHSADFLPRLDCSQIISLLQFCGDLAEEGMRLTRPDERKVHDRLMLNVEEVDILLQHTFGTGFKRFSEDSEETQAQGEKICLLTLKTWAAWVFYAQNEFKETSEKLDHLRDGIEFAIDYMACGVEEAAELLAEMLERYPKFFLPAHLDKLWTEVTGPWGIKRLKTLNDDTQTAARLVLSYAQILLDSGPLCTQPDSTQSKEVIEALHILLDYPAIPAVEDETIPLVTEFINNYISTVAERLFEYTEEDPEPYWTFEAKFNIIRFVQGLLDKNHFPESEVLKEWDKDAKQAFKSWRSDVRDLLQLAYEPLGRRLLTILVKRTIHFIDVGEWTSVEGHMFSLNSLADIIPGTPEDDALLERLFGLQAYKVMIYDPSIPMVLLRTIVESISSFHGFFFRHPEHLEQMLPFLFKVLEHPNLAHEASKAFATLCSTNRKHLSGMMEEFFPMYQQFATYQTAEEYTTAKVLEGISALVQARQDDSQKKAGLEKLFGFLANDAQLAIEHGNSEDGQVIAQKVLKGLAAIGRGMQADDEQVIDLEAEQAPSTYWTLGEGRTIQDKVVEFINVLTGHYGAVDGEVIEAACDVLRKGYREAVPGPFVLPPIATVDFICNINLQTPRLPYILDTAVAFVASHKKDKSDDYRRQSRRLLLKITDLMRDLGHPRSDPDVSVGCVEVIQKFINTDISVLSTVGPDTLQGVFNFSIECLRAPEVLPKRAAAAFWTDVFALAGNIGDPASSSAQEINSLFGQVVTSALIFNVCGEVEPSSLDNITTPLRQLLRTDKNSRAYVTEAIKEQALIRRAINNGFEDDITPPTKRFIDGAFRNARTTAGFRETVKDFWGMCKKLAMQLGPETAQG